MFIILTCGKATQVNVKFVLNFIAVRTSRDLIELICHVMEANFIQSCRRMSSELRTLDILFLVALLDVLLQRLSHLLVCSKSW